MVAVCKNWKAVAAVLAALLLLVIFASEAGGGVVAQPEKPDFEALGCSLVSGNTYAYPDIGVGSECGVMPASWPGCWVWDEVVGETEVEGLLRAVLHQSQVWSCPSGANPCEAASGR
ncbi:MAG: hypothetical protein ABH814_01345 [bacterium]